MPTVTWSTPSAITYGTALSSAQLNASALAPGTITYSPALGTVPTAGTVSITATFTPTDTADYVAITNSVALTVNKASLTVAANSTARVFGSANPGFTGTITGAVNGDALTESFATAATQLSTVGSYPIIPSATGTNIANYAPVIVNGAVTISQAGTATAFALSNSNLTITASVVSLTSGTPTGTVAFYQGQTQIGSSTLANGVAIYTIISFPAGDVAISAQYSGDANFTQSVSAPTSVLAVSPVSTTLTVSRTGSVSDILNLAVAPGYVGTVQFSCTGLPAATTCTFQPASAIFTGATNTAVVTVTIQTGVQAKALTPPLFPDSRRTLALSAFLCFPGLFLFASKHRRKPLYRLTLLLLLSSLGMAAIGCGSSPTSTTLPTTSAGTSTVQVVATGPANLSQTTSLTLTVQ